MQTTHDKSWNSVIHWKTDESLNECCCGARPVLVRRGEGMLKAWRVECLCGRETAARLHDFQAVHAWNSIQCGGAASVQYSEGGYDHAA